VDGSSLSTGNVDPQEKKHISLTATLCDLGHRTVDFEAFSFFLVGIPKLALRVFQHKRITLVSFEAL
jgi:hypothetical protein